MADTAPNDAAPNATAAAQPVAAATAVTAPAEPSGPLVVSGAEPPKVKIRKHKQRSCNEKNEKGKLCAGHLKRWYTFPKAVEALIGPNAEIYRCEFCQTLYRPDPEQ